MNFEWTDADISWLKKCFAAKFQEGHPLILYPHLVKDVTAKGFEEGVHFIVSKPIPLDWRIS